MTHEADFFKPDQVDEQVEQLARHNEQLYESDTGPEQPGKEHLIETLQAYYQDEQAQDKASLERAWKRVAHRLPASTERSQKLDKPAADTLLRFPQERIRFMPNDVSTHTTIERNSPERPKTAGRHLLRRLGLIAATLVAVLLVGSLLVVLNLSHQSSKTASSGAQQKATPTPKPLPPGTIVYTTPKNTVGFVGVTWSPDSKRVASATENGVQIWDATTGAHLVTIPFSSTQWPIGITWAPNSQEVAIATNQSVLLIDGQTGQVLRTFTQGVVSEKSASATGQGWLSSLFPDSGGFGYRATAWSPDGKSMASAISYGPTSAVQVWNTQTGAVDFTLQPGGSFVIGSVAWSSDGQYIAVSAFDSQPTNPGALESLVIVWNAETHQVVFNHTDSMDGDATVVWQPGSHNLAFTGATTSGSNQIQTLEIWNATSGKEVAHFTGGADSLAWSPDGKDLAYLGTVLTGKTVANAAFILHVATGQKDTIAVPGVGGVALAWSPNGTYIVSAQGPDQQIVNGKFQTLPSVATVWVA